MRRRERTRERESAKMMRMLQYDFLCSTLDSVSTKDLINSRNLGGWLAQLMAFSLCTQRPGFDSQHSRKFPLDVC